MFKIAWKTLFSCGKNFTLSLVVLGISLALILTGITQLKQSSRRAGHWIQEMEKVDLWVYPKRPFAPSDLSRLRSLEGVDTASPFCQKSVVITLPNGIKEEAILLGVEELAFPRVLSQGKLSHLQLEQSIIADEGALQKTLTYNYRGKKKNFKLGQYLLVGEHKMLLGGVCKLKSVHNTPLLYTSYNNAISLFEAKNEDLHAYIIKTKAGVSSTKLAETIERLFAVEVRPHMLVVTDHLPTTSSQTPFPLLIGVFLGFLLYVSTLWEIVSAVTKQAKIFRNLGAGLSFLTCFFGIQTFILFVGGWLFAIGICYGLQLSCQMLIPATWGYSFLVAIASLFIALGLMIKGEYASYRL